MFPVLLRVGNPEVKNHSILLNTNLILQIKRVELRGVATTNIMHVSS